jgi:hypothetical protein
MGASGNAALRDWLCLDERAIAELMREEAV